MAPYRAPTPPRAARVLGPKLPPFGLAAQDMSFFGAPQSPASTSLLPRVVMQVPLG